MSVGVVTIYLGVRISLVDIRSERRTRLSIDNDLGSLSTVKSLVEKL